jgi:HTH-type transcriptional regulator/antitoxin HigA
MPTARSVDASYQELINEFPLRPLRSEEDLTEAIAVIDKLTDRPGKLSQGQRDYLEVLGRLVHDYESEHDPLPDLTGIEALRFLLEENGLNQKQLAEQTGIPEATLSAVIRGNRQFSPKVRAELARRFGVSPSVFF